MEKTILTSQTIIPENVNNPMSVPAPNCGTDETTSTVGHITPKIKREPVSIWNHPAVIAPNNFKFKSLSNWSFNIAIGCSHACRFCYVPSVATNKQAPELKENYGIDNPDSEWGAYVLLRQWDENGFLRSLKKAEQENALKPDGNRAVIYCSTTDPYQVVHHSDPARQKELAAHARFIVRRSLELILEHSTINVRILTRSPLAQEDFDLFKKFGNRLAFGMSLPTLDNRLSKIYEPKAPSSSSRLKTLQKAKAAGLHVFVAMAPTYPECDPSDLRKTLTAIKELDPITVFHEPINIRAENVVRIEEHAASLNPPVKLNTEVFKNSAAWRRYALGSLMMVERLADEIGLGHCLHLWPDKSLKSNGCEPQVVPWLESWWSRISEWPGRQGINGWSRPKPLSRQGI